MTKRYRVYFTIEQLHYGEIEATSQEDAIENFLYDDDEVIACDDIEVKPGSWHAEEIKEEN